MEVEISESASILGYEVVNLDTVNNQLIINGEKLSTQNMGDEILKLPIIMSTVDYAEYANLPPFQSWSKNRARLLRDVEALGFKNWTSIVMTPMCQEFSSRDLRLRSSSVEFLVSGLTASV